MTRKELVEAIEADYVKGAYSVLHVGPDLYRILISYARDDYDELVKHSFAAKVIDVRVDYSLKKNTWRFE